MRNQELNRQQQPRERRISQMIRQTLAFLDKQLAAIEAEIDAMIQQDENWRRRRETIESIRQSSWVSQQRWCENAVSGAAALRLLGVEEKDTAKRRPIPDGISRREVELAPGADACAGWGGRPRRIGGMARHAPAAGPGAMPNEAPEDAGRAASS